jgi:hypothetical protein
MNLGARAETRRYIKIYLGFLGTPRVSAAGRDSPSRRGKARLVTLRRHVDFEGLRLRVVDLGRAIRPKRCWSMIRRIASDRVGRSSCCRRQPGAAVRGVSVRLAGSS